MFDRLKYFFMAGVVLYFYGKSLNSSESIMYCSQNTKQIVEVLGFEAIKEREFLKKRYVSVKDKRNGYLENSDDEKKSLNRETRIFFNRTFGMQLSTAYKQNEYNTKSALWSFFKAIDPVHSVLWDHGLEVWAVYNDVKDLRKKDQAFSGIEKILLSHIANTIGTYHRSLAAILRERILKQDYLNSYRFYIEKLAKYRAEVEWLEDVFMPNPKEHQEEFFIDKKKYNQLKQNAITKYSTVLKRIIHSTENSERFEKYSQSSLMLTQSQYEKLMGLLKKDTLCEQSFINAAHAQESFYLEARAKIKKKLWRYGRKIDRKNKSLWNYGVSFLEYASDTKTRGRLVYRDIEKVLLSCLANLIEPFDAQAADLLYKRVVIENQKDLRLFVPVMESIKYKDILKNFLKLPFFRNSIPSFTN